MERRCWRGFSERLCYSITRSQIRRAQCLRWLQYEKCGRPDVGGVYALVAKSRHFEPFRIWLYVHLGPGGRTVRCQAGRGRHFYSRQMIFRSLRKRHCMIPACRDQFYLTFKSTSAVSSFSGLTLSHMRILRMVDVAGYHRASDSDCAAQDRSICG